jgi:protein-S-isoprenylcysteine O-methyltransferase Ste14
MNNTETHLAVFLLLALLLLIASYIVFRLIVRRDYLLKGHLGWLSSSLQLVVFGGIFSFPYIFNPPEWALPWRLDGPTGLPLQILGLAIIILGFIIAFGIMAWFGLQRAFGLELKGLIHTGPYRITRNPQIIGGYLMFIGVTVQWPSWYSLGWIILYGIICHFMIITEEEHLSSRFGEEYKCYLEQIPRYLFNIERPHGKIL